METPIPATPQRPNAGRFAWLTPTRFLIGLLAGELMLLASERYQWFGFNQRPGWTVLIAIVLLATALLLMAGWFGFRLLRRRTVQFDLAAILALIVVVAIPCGWFVRIRQCVADEAQATAWVKQRVGSMGFVTFSGTEEFVFRADPKLRPFPRPAITRARAGRQTAPEWLEQWLGPDFFDGGLWVLRFGDRFPPGTIEDRVARPEKLYAGEQYDLTDGEAYHLSTLRNLEVLSISSRKLTDAGLRSLHGLRGLKSLTLVTPNVTPAAVAEFQRNLPGCQVTQYDDVVETASHP
jgi:hypothetical protein